MTDPTNEKGTMARSRTAADGQKSHAPAEQQESHAPAETRRPRTLAEAQGMTAEIGRAIAEVAHEELQAGRLAVARDILHGLAVSNPYDPATWAMLAVLERRRGKLTTARICAETSFRLAPRDAQVRLVRAEVLLCLPPERPRAIAELTDLVGVDGPIGARAAALLAAVGDPAARTRAAG